MFLGRRRREAFLPTTQWSSYSSRSAVCVLKLDWFDLLRICRTTCKNAYNKSTTSTISTPSSTPIPRPITITTDRNSDPINHFSTIYPPDRRTDRLARRQLCYNTSLRSIVLIESDAAKNAHLTTVCLNGRIKSR